MTFERLPSGAPIIRVHHRRFAPDEFSAPRRLPFGPPVVPTLYAAHDTATAIAEALFHDVPVGGNLLRAAVSGRVLTRLHATRDLHLIALEDRAIVEATASEYGRTAAAAERLHDGTPEADGIGWTSRHFPAERGLVLFGDRITDLIATGRPLALDRGPGLDLVEETAMRANVGLLF